MKCGDAGLHFRVVRGCGQEHADKAHPIGLLRARGERRDRHRTTGKSHEIAPPQDRLLAKQGIIPIKPSTLDAGRMRGFGGKADVRIGSMLCENSNAELARRISISILSLRKPIALVGAGGTGQLRKQF
jgi:hypothetical protein